VQLHTWVELAQWKLVGVIFIIVGDADGQRKPIFDRWQDAVDDKDIRKSSLIHELCGGLRLNMSVYRRGVDQSLFDLFTCLYPYADDDSKVPEIAGYLLEAFPWVSGPKPEQVCQTFFVQSHKKRILLNHAMNWLFAKDHMELLFIKSVGEKPGWTMQPQDMIIWKGMEMLCYSRRYCKNSPVSGAVYVVESWDAENVTVSLHQDYVGERLIEAPGAEAELEEEAPSDDEALENLGDVAEDKGVSKGVVGNKTLYKLTYKRASELLRPQHALVYASIQGRTIRQRSCLMDVFSPHRTVRDIITAMSRPTKCSDLKVMSEKQQKDLLRDLEERRRFDTLDLQKRVRDVMSDPPSERPTPTRIGR